MGKQMSMLNGSRLGQQFQAKVVDITHYLFNKSPPSMLEGKTRHQVQIGKNPCLTHIKVFGRNAYVNFPKEKRTKLEGKHERCSFIGYKYDLRCYNIWNLEKNKVVYSQDVVFREVEDVMKQEYLPREKELENIVFDLNSED